MVNCISNYTDLININWGSIERNHDIFMSKDWLYIWLKYYGDKKDYRIYYATDESNEIKAVFPIAFIKEKDIITCTQIYDSCTDYSYIICDKRSNKIALELINFIFQKETFEKMIINNILMQSDTLKILLEIATKNKKESKIAFCEDNYYISTSGDYYDYCQKRSKNLKTKIKKIKKQTNYIFQVGLEYNEEILNEMMEIHRQRWKDSMQASTYFDSRREGFVKDICQFFSLKNKLRIFILKDSNTGKIVAYRFGFINQKKYYDWNTSFDINYKQQSIGILLCNYVIQYCFENNIEEFNFLRGGENYKKAFSTGKRELVTINIDNTLYTNTKNHLSPQEGIKEVLMNKKGFIFDLDGVVYAGNNPIDNTIRFINYLQEKNYSVGFLTNTSSKSIDDIRKKLNHFGIRDPFYIETSASATAQYLIDNNIRICAVFGGGKALPNEMEIRNIEVVDISSRQKNIEALVIGYSTDYDYEKLIHINAIIAKGARLIATDEDRMFSHNKKCLPGTGWILSSIETVNNIHATVIGKPNDIALSYLLRKMSLQACEIVIVGDNLDSDIKSAKLSNSQSCLLLGGVSNMNDVARLDAKSRPEIVLDDLNKLKPFMEELYERKN